MVGVGLVNAWTVPTIRICQCDFLSARDGGVYYMAKEKFTK